MNIDNDPRIERPGDPNAPVTLNLQKCQRWIATARNVLRQPMGDYLFEVLQQLKCAIEQLTTVDTKVADANNQVLRYQKEAETANGEVRVMQRMLGEEREKIATLEQQVAALATERDTLKTRVEALETPPVAPLASAPKRGRRAKVVPIEAHKVAGQ